MSDIVSWRRKSPHPLKLTRDLGPHRVDFGRAETEERVRSTRDRRDTLARDGYLAIDQMADAQDIARIRDICTGLFARNAGFGEGRQFDMVGIDDAAQSPRLPQILKPHLDAPELRTTRFFNDAASLARDLLGPDAYFIFDHVIKKPPYDGAATPRHQDEAFRDPMMEYQEITIWLPLQPVDERNGCMEFIPGTNRGGVLPHRSPDGDRRVHALECFAGFDPATEVTCPLPLGGCTVHTGRTVHGTGANASPEPRYAYIVVFELPPRPRVTPHDYPWQQGRQTVRETREQAWKQRGGIVILAWRKLVRIWRRRSNRQ